MRGDVKPLETGSAPMNAALVLLMAAMLLLGGQGRAQDAAPTATATEDSQATPTATSASATVESPFLQDDLAVLVGNVQRPNGILWFQDSLFTVCNGDWTVYRIDDVTGDTSTFIFGVRNGNSLIAEQTGSGFNLWIPDPDNSTIWRVDHLRGAPARFTSSIEGPWGIARLADGRFLVSDTVSNSIIEIAEDGSTREAQAGFRAPTGIASDGERLYIANGGSARRGIEYITLEADGAYSEVKPLVSGLQNTSNLVMGSDNRLYFAYALGTRGVVGRVDPARCLEAGCRNQDIELIVFSDIAAPLAITLSDDMRLFLHSRFRPEIYWLQLPE